MGKRLKALSELFRLGFGHSTKERTCLPPMGKGRRTQIFTLYLLSRIRPQEPVFSTFGDHLFDRRVFPTRITILSIVPPRTPPKICMTSFRHWQMTSCGRPLVPGRETPPPVILRAGHRRICPESMTRGRTRSFTNRALSDSPRPRTPNDSHPIT